MKDYAAEMDRILADYTAASRGVHEQFLEADARTTRSGAEVFTTLRQELIEYQPRSPEEPGPLDTHVEHHPRPDEQAASRTTGQRGGPARTRQYASPSDWTDEDQARTEGYGPPKTWLS